MATKMPTTSIPSTFPHITKVHVKETFALYNQFLKNVMKYQSTIKDLAITLSEFSHSYDSFLSYEPLRAIIESNNKQYDIFDSLEIHRVLYECLMKMSEYLEKNFGHLSGEFEKNQNKYYEKDIEKSLKAEEKLRAKGYLPAQPTIIQRKIYKQYISAIHFITHKTKKFQNCEIQLLKNSVQNMISINNRNIEKNILHNLDKSLDKSLNHNTNRESSNLNSEFFLDFPELEKILKSIPHDKVPLDKSFIKDDAMDNDDYRHQSLGYPQKKNSMKFNSLLPSSTKKSNHHLKDRPRSSSLKNLTPNNSDPGKHVTFVDKRAVYKKFNGINDPASSTDSLQSYCSARSCNSTQSYIRHRTGDMNILSNKPYTSTIPNGYATPMSAHQNIVFHPSEFNNIIPIDYATPMLPERPAMKGIQTLNLNTPSLSSEASNDELPLSPPLSIKSQSPPSTKSQLPPSTKVQSPPSTKSQLPPSTKVQSPPSTKSQLPTSTKSTTTKSTTTKSTTTKSQLPTSTSTKSTTTKSTTTKSQLPTSTSTKSTTTKSTTTKSQLPTSTSTKSTTTKSTTTKSQIPTSTSTKSTTTKSQLPTSTKSKLPSSTKSKLHTSLPALKTLRRRPARNESLKFCPSLNKQEVKDNDLKIPLKIDNKYPKNSTCSTESVISAIESEIIDSIKERNIPNKDNIKNSGKIVTPNVSPSYSIKTKVNSNNTEEDTAFNTNSETSTIVDIKINGNENELDNVSIMSETTMKEIVTKESREEQPSDLPDNSKQSDHTSALPKLNLNNIAMNNIQPSELNNDNQNGNNDVIIFSNPLMEITNNKNLAVYKKNLPNERLELHVLRNKAYIALNLCPQSVEAESVIGSIVDTESAVGSYVDPYEC